MKRFSPAVVVLLLMAAGCADESATDTTSVETTSPAADTTMAPDSEPAGPAVAPAEVVFENQSSDGGSIVVASVTLPSPGFIAVHGNADGAPGAVVGHSDLLPAGTSTDVTITLDQALTATDMLFPMAHIDFDEDGEYDFMPPDVTDDIPAQTESGDVAVVGAEVTVEG